MSEKRKGGAHLAYKESHSPKKRPQKHSESTDRSSHKRPSRKVIVTGSVVLAVFLVLLAAVLFVNSKLNKLDYNDGKVDNPVQSTPPEEETALDVTGLKASEPKAATTALIGDDDVYNILLLGTDERELEFKDDARADAVMILSLDFKNNAVKLTSLQRGIGMPMLEGQYKDHYDLITHCFAYGGADLIMRQIQQCLKVDVDRYVRVNLSMLIKVIDVIGGVDVELTEKEAWYLNIVREGGSTYPYLHHGFIRGDGSSEEYPFVEGENHLSGVMALAYSRLRAIDDDFHRVERQRTVLQACAEKLKSADLATLNKLADEILPLVRTNLTKSEIAGLALKAPGMLKADIEQMTLPAEGTYGAMVGLFERDVLALDFDANSRILQEFIYGKS